MIGFREATAADLPAIARIHTAAWRAAYSSILSNEVLSRATESSRLAFWQEWFAAGNHEIHLLEERGEVIGFCRICEARPLDDPPAGFGELTHLYLEPALIAKGKGRQIFDYAKNRLEHLGYAGMLLWTLEDNSRARSFYESRGMYTDGARKDQPEWLGEGIYEIRYILPFVSSSVDQRA